MAEFLAGYQSRSNYVEPDLTHKAELAENMANPSSATRIQPLLLSLQLLLC